MANPEVQDYVKNKVSGVTGTVIAKYPLEEHSTTMLLDVRSANEDEIWWATPMKNWEVLIEYDEAKA